MREKILIVSNVTAGLASFRCELIEALSKKYEDGIVIMMHDSVAIEKKSE